MSKELEELFDKLDALGKKWHPFTGGHKPLRMDLVDPWDGKTIDSRTLEPKECRKFAARELEPLVLRAMELIAEERKKAHDTAIQRS